MDETFVSKEPKYIVFKKKCPVKIGDIFYRNNYEVKKGRIHPDRIIVEKIVPSTESDEEYYITGRYLQHTVETHRTFSSIIFNDPDWIIESK